MKVIVSVSGGMDSATLLAHVCGPWKEACGITSVSAVGFTYGSKHNPWENNAAVALCHHYGLPLRIKDLSQVFTGLDSDLLLSGGAVPEGHYEEENMRRTVVPGRNIVFASVLAAIAMSEGAEKIYLGVHAGDHYIYPDCRPSFVTSMDMAIHAGTEKVRLIAPFLHLSKADILRRGLELSPPVPYELTRTCYTADEVACGRCGSCQERLEAFARAGREDPLSYRFRELMPKGR